MNIPDELLAAYVEGSLQGAERARVEQALLHDVRLAQRLARYRSARARRGQWGKAMHDAPRLARTGESAVRPALAQVIDLARVRAERKRRNERHRFAQPQRILAIAASLVCGLTIGAVADRLLIRGSLTEYHDGLLNARGALAAALTDQLSAASATDGDVQVGMTFRSRNGPLCRTFSVSKQSLAGLACHEGTDWQVLALVNNASPLDAPPAQPTRPITAGASPLMQQAVRESIAGEPLDAQAEARARGSNWR